MNLFLIVLNVCKNPFKHWKDTQSFSGAIIDELALQCSISTSNSDKISKIWDETRIKLGCNEDKIWIKWERRFGKNKVSLQLNSNSIYILQIK